MFHPFMNMKLVENGENYSEYFILTSNSGAAVRNLTGIVCFFLVKRQIPPIDARQPFDQALWKMFWKGLLLRRVYITSRNPF